MTRPTDQTAARGRRRRPPLLLAWLALVAVGAALLLAGARFGSREERQGLSVSGMKRVGAALLAWAAPAAASPAQASPPAPPTVIGINPAEIRYYSTTVPFANLVVGSGWLSSRWEGLPAEHVGRGGVLRSLPADNVAYRFLLVPPTGPEGFEVRCTFAGSGTLTAAGLTGPARPGPHSLTFRLVNERGKQPRPWLVARDVKASDPLRDLDCRDTRVPAAARFRPEFLATLRGFGVVRFMDWQSANANGAVAWRDRTTPTDIDLGLDGVSIEDMLALTRELRADPWFVMPWNADDDYIGRFARMVREQLPPGRHVYVEVGNEVWNGGFPVGRQAVQEGLARKLGADGHQAGLRRYAERTVAAMRLWEGAFAGRPGLVRVLSTQHAWPETARIALGWRDTAQHVDALATAPYFGDVMGGTGNTRDSALAAMAASMAKTMDLVTENRSVAASFGKRYIAYEGGQGLVLPAQVELAKQLQHDPAMYDLYRRFLSEWGRRAGDLFCHYSSVNQPTPSGSWGLAAWEDETLADAPKLRAVRESLGAGRP